jgi:hypothetical protein
MKIVAGVTSSSVLKTAAKRTARLWKEFFFRAADYGSAIVAGPYGAFGKREKSHVS